MSVLEPSGYWEGFAAELRELGYQPVLIGGLAARRHRHSDRFTTDVDFLCDHELDRLSTPWSPRASPSGP